MSEQGDIARQKLHDMRWGPHIDDDLEIQEILDGAISTAIGAISALEAKLEAMKRDADTEYRFWRNFVMNEGNQAHVEMWNCLSRLATGNPIDREDDFINIALATAQEDKE